MLHTQCDDLIDFIGQRFLLNVRPLIVTDFFVGNINKPILILLCAISKQDHPENSRISKIIHLFSEKHM